MVITDSTLQDEYNGENGLDVILEANESTQNSITEKVEENNIQLVEQSNQQTGENVETNKETANASPNTSVDCNKQDLKEQVPEAATLEENTINTEGQKEASSVETEETADPPAMEKTEDGSSTEPVEDVDDMDEVKCVTPVNKRKRNKDGNSSLKKTRQSAC